MTPRRATRGEWAEKAVDKLADWQDCGPRQRLMHDEIERLVKDEHARAVRIVKAEIAFVKKDQHTYHSEEKCLILGALETVLNKLTRGR